MSNPNLREYSEKRDFIRMRVDTELSLTLAAEGKTITGICRDLSGKGMLIEVDQVIPVDSLCNTNLPSSNAAFPGLDARIKVLRCTPIEAEEGSSEQRFLIGAEIVEIEH